MQYDPDKMSIRDIYRLMVQLITPRPIAWVSSISASGVTNLAPFSFFNGVGANPPSVVFCPVNRPDGSLKDSLLNIKATREFVVNVVSYDLAETMNLTSAEYDREVSEFDMLGIATAPSVLIAPPRVAKSLAQMECRLIQAIHLAEGPAAANLVIGEILMLHVDDDVLSGEGRIDPAKMDTIGRLGGRAYARTTERFTLDRVTLPK
jgi:flavin reductase (DIM6/NTAB) family NADH-FMN oxidoreductase RutF